MARTKIQLTWDPTYPEGVRVEQRHYPPPPHLSGQELENNRRRYSDALASWCESKMGQQVGDGECWTLASDGLKAIAAKCKSRDQEPCMASQSLIHGFPVYTLVPAIKPDTNPGRSILECGVARGDIIQILTAHFESKDGRRQSWAGAPDHTAVVTGIDSNGVLAVVEQNVGGVKKVQVGSYDLSEMIKGEVRIFRAVGEGWIGPLDPTW